MDDFQQFFQDNTPPPTPPVQEPPLLTDPSSSMQEAPPEPPAPIPTPPPFWNPQPSDYPPDDNLMQQPPKPNNGGRVVFWVALVMMLLMIAFGFYCIFRDIQRGTFSGGYRAGDIVEVSIGQQHKPGNAATYQNPDGSYTTEGIANLVRPSIVEIYTYEDELTASTTGLGSGIILSEDGYIVTNTHVLDAGTFYQVRLSDETVHVGKLIGRDAKTDIAVLKIDAINLTAASLGDSDEVVLGEGVVTIGNPAGLTGTISNGIVSGLNRKVRTDSTGYEMTCIQTNAAISSGNSGGALVNMYGQVIGITSSKYVSSTYEGLGFAITINEALPILKELISQGYVGGRVRIGISFFEAQSDYAVYMFEKTMGYALPEDLNAIWVGKIAEDCDIANTELKPGDFILKVNGEDVHDYDSLYSAYADAAAGDTVRAECVRLDSKGEEYHFTISFKLMEDTSGDY